MKEKSTVVRLIKSMRAAACMVSKRERKTPKWNKNKKHKKVFMEKYVRWGGEKRVIRKGRNKNKGNKKGIVKRLILGVLIKVVWHLFSFLLSVRLSVFSKPQQKLQEYMILSLSSIIHSNSDENDKISIGKTHARTHASTRARPTHTHTHTYT